MTGVHAEARTQVIEVRKPCLYRWATSLGAFCSCSFFSFFYLCGCLGQLARTTTNLTAHWTPCKPSRHVRHHEDNRHAHEDSNPGTAKEISPSHRQPKTLSAFCSCSCFYTYWPSKWHVKTPSRLMEFDIVCRSLAYY
jgi:hypothetical protein